MEENQIENTPVISLNDFSAILKIIDVASLRGAFEGHELTSVGTIRDKVQAFIVHYGGEAKKEIEKEGDGKDEVA